MGVVVNVMLLLPQIGRRGPLPPPPPQQRSAAALSPLLFRPPTTGNGFLLTAVLRTSFALLLLVSRPSCARGECRIDGTQHKSRSSVPNCFSANLIHFIIIPSPNFLPASVRPSPALHQTSTPTTVGALRGNDVR